MPHSLVQMLRGVPDFSPLDERSLLAIVGESLNLFWRAGSLIFEPGQPGDALYIILSGEVVICAETGEEVARLRAGDSFGEISLLLNTVHRRRANAVQCSQAHRLRSSRATPTKSSRRAGRRVVVRMRARFICR